MRIGPMMAQWTVSGPALAGCSLYDDLEIRDMCVHLREDSKFIVIPRCPYFLLEQFYSLFLLSFNIQLEIKIKDLTSLPGEGKWLGVVSSIGGSGCRRNWRMYRVCVVLSPFSQTNNFEINVHNYLWPPLLRTTAIKLINRGRLSVSLDCCVIRGGHK